jgi:hypothetical protein
VLGVCASTETTERFRDTNDFVPGYAGFSVGKTSCGWFTWAEFDEDGKPPWVEGYKGNTNGPTLVTESSSEQDASK